ncbi:hypothetical protein ES703_84358 [subsurface metagenome]
MNSERKAKMQDAVLFCQCERCGAQLQVGPAPGSEAKLLRRSKVPKGFCVNCAVHNFLRNTYPPNIQLAESGPEILLIPHIQTVFADIMKAGFADANPDEIDWQRIVDNWELPFPTKLKTSGMNPCSQKELDEVAAGTRSGLGAVTEDSPLVKNRGVIKSFEELNELEPGLGDDLRDCLQKGG